jgi:hypothetical protein
MSIVEDRFRPIYGKPCWHARQGYGSFLTFEFGEPHLYIREPRVSADRASAGVRKNAARRLVTLHGDWHLWIYLCDWRIFSHRQLIASSDSKNRIIKQAVSELDGQALIRATVNSSLVSEFEFDLGDKLGLVQK